MILKMLRDTVCERQVFPIHKSIYRSGETCESFKLELDGRNEEVIVIISHDLEGVEKAPPETVQAGQSESVITLKKKTRLVTN